RQLGVNELTDFRRILEPDVNLVYYKRTVDKDIDQYVRCLVGNNFKGIQEIITHQSLVGVVTDQLYDIGLHTIGKVKLTKDIIELTLMFMEVTSADRLRLILKVVGDDACRKFHTDAYDLRLLCTYVG